MSTNTKNLHSYNMLHFFLCITIFPILAIATDTITPTQPLTNNKTLISEDEVFELGFFNPGNSNWYVGIWYKQVTPRTYVWVANRDNPLGNSQGSLIIGENGNLVLINNSDNPIWSSNHSSQVNVVARLLNSGNLVIYEVGDSNYLWESFNYPTDTLLPGMKLGWDQETGLTRYLTSWKAENDPSTGDFTFKLNTTGFPEIFLYYKNERTYRSGPWNGLRFSGVPEMKQLDILTFLFRMEPNEVYYSFELGNKSVYSRLVMGASGNLQRFTWIDNRDEWNNFWYAPKDQCDRYLECGEYGICDTNVSPVCKCMKGFRPRNMQAWRLRDGGDGCVRTSKLNCSGDGFLPFRNMKLPESSGSGMFVSKSMDLGECENMCKENCDCMGFSKLNITGAGSGCAIWENGLFDMRQYAVGEGGQDLFVRVAASDVGSGSRSAGNGSKKTKMAIKITSIIVSIFIFLSVLAACFLRKKNRFPSGRKDKIVNRGISERSRDLLLKEAVIRSKIEDSDETTTDELELPLFELLTIVMATNNFSDENKLGQGGFGCVYKGVLEDQDIAVKRLSRNSGQGIEEFKNEVQLIARLQHRNLVRLLGCCINMEEKMLIYEYMENRSLDSVLFDKERSSLLNWHKRFTIICGIARGLLYLHQDSRFRIIHRDLKASNILLDKEMNPKISDFGMARIFGGDQIEANTKRIVGTYGYMAPEYAMDGLFSVKSDVFSFGVLVLEVVSGKKNRGFYNSNNQHNLLGHVWKLWREGKGLEIMDSTAGDKYSADEVMRCIQVGLLCVQEQAEERPVMSNVMFMLSSENATLPQPKHPGFCLGRRHHESDSSSNKPDESFTLNQLTVTMLDGR